MSVIRTLERRRYKVGGCNKYYMDCSKSYGSDAEHARALDVQGVLVYKADVGVLEAVARDDTIRKKNRHIVIKIGPAGKSVRMEYDIGRALFAHKLPGFIKFLCLFPCLDDGHQAPDAIAHVCQATDDAPQNRKDVLLMPYIHAGSIRKAIWTADKIPLLKVLLIQTVTAVSMAYDALGFIHNDLHLDNVLFKATKQTEFHPGSGIPTYGYKVVIMDFEGCMMGVDRTDGLAFFWGSLLNVLSRVNFDLASDANGGKLAFVDMTSIMQEIERKPYRPKETMMAWICRRIWESSFDVVPRPASAAAPFVYDPNVFG